MKFGPFSKMRKTKTKLVFKLWCVFSTTTTTDKKCKVFLKSFFSKSFIFNKLTNSFVNLFTYRQSQVFNKTEEKSLQSLKSESKVNTKRYISSFSLDLKTLLFTIFYKSASIMLARKNVSILCLFKNEIRPNVKKRKVDVLLKSTNTCQIHIRWANQ